MLKNIFLYTLVLIFLFACATPAKYDEKLSAMTGQKASTLVKEWGRPTSRGVLGDGTEIYIYTKSNDVYVPSQFYVYNQGFEPSEDVVYQPFNNDAMFNYAANTGYEVEEICQTAFIIQNGIVTGWKWRGNDCVAR